MMIFSIIFINKCNAQTWTANDMNGVSYDMANFTVGINDITYVTPSDTRIFDILGREWKRDFIDLPKGMYIINNNKIFKTR